MEFTKKETFSIRCIEKAEGGWNFYPVDSKEPIFVPWFGKKISFARRHSRCTLELETFKGENVISVVIDGETVFKLEEKDYPDELKENLAYLRKLEQQDEAEKKAYDKQLVPDLVTYLKSIPENLHLEDEISKLSLPLRVYLRLHLFQGTCPEDPEGRLDFKRRLSLMLVLSQIAQRIYRRHIDEKKKNDRFSLEFVAAPLLFGSSKDSIFPDYRFDMRGMEESVGVEKSHQTWFVYYETKELLEKELPSCQPNVREYLNYVVRHLLFLLAEDWKDLVLHFARDFRGNRFRSDEEEYLSRYDEKKLPNYTNFILPEEIPSDRIKYFFGRYTLS